MFKRVFKFYRPKGGMKYGWTLEQDKRRIAQGQNRTKIGAEAMAAHAMCWYWGRKIT